MRIIIIGAGISGCTIYLELRKHLPKPPSGEAHKITIYEAYDTSIDTTSDDRGNGPTHSSTLIVGGGLGVAANGLNVIKRLDEDMLREIVRGGYSCATMNMKSKNGKVLARMQPAGKPALDGKGQGTMNTVACSRHALWRELRKRVPDDVIVTKRVLKWSQGLMAQRGEFRRWESFCGGRSAHRRRWAQGPGQEGTISG
ncbi:hypothetical protein J3459_011244 [Metarhizium acridum]|nr:hypothetical protein J3459_011244 [Metarhizium acridum]